MEGRRWKTPAWAKAASTNYSFRKGKKIQMPGPPLGSTLGLHGQEPAAPQDTPARSIEEQEECGIMDISFEGIETCYGFTQRYCLPLNDPLLSTYEKSLIEKRKYITREAKRRIKYVAPYIERVLPYLRAYDEASIEELKTFSTEKLESDNDVMHECMVAIERGIADLAKLLENTDSCFAVDEILPALRCYCILTQVYEYIKSKTLPIRRSRTQE